jgi:hypothetical protein
MIEYWKRARHKWQAVAQAQTLFRHASIGDRAYRRKLSHLGCAIAVAVWDCFEVGPSRFQQKHLAWFVANRISAMPTADIEPFFVAVCMLAHKLDRLDAWWPKLNGEITRVCEQRGCAAIPRPTLKRQPRPTAERCPPDHSPGLENTCTSSNPP